MMRSAVLFAAPLGVATVLTVAAAAQPTVGELTVRAHPSPLAETKSEAINYRDLNVGTLEGVETLLGRIRKASEDVCRPAPVSSRNLKEFQDYRRCKDEAMQGAVVQAKNPTLTMLYKRTG